MNKYINLDNLLHEIEYEKEKRNAEEQVDWIYQCLQNAPVVDYKSIEKVNETFRILCECSFNQTGIKIVTGNQIANIMRTSWYLVNKYLHILRDRGLVEIDCQTIVKKGEKCIPIRGWSVTAEGYKTEEFQKAKENFEKEQAEKTSQ